MSKERHDVLKILQEIGEPITPKGLGELIGKTPDATRYLLGKLADEGTVKKIGYGLYTYENIPSGPSSPSLPSGPSGPSSWGKQDKPKADEGEDIPSLRLLGPAKQGNIGQDEGDEGVVGKEAFTI